MSGRGTGDIKMKPSEKCKAEGLKSLAELSEIIGESVQTLNNWYKHKPKVFDAVLMWAVQHQQLGEEMKITARDFSTGELVELTAKLTIEHSTSSHGQPVMIIKEWDAGIMSYDNWKIADCVVTEPGSEEQQELFKRWVQTDLQQRIDRLKTTAMMKARERMGPVELVNWWTTFRQNVLKKEKFEELDEKTQAQIVEWEAYPYEIISP
jgi:hypothetical protein